MACRVKMQALFTGRVNGLLGNLAGNEGVDTETRRAINKALAAAGAPCHALHGIRPGVAAPQRTTPQACFDPRCQLQTRNRHRQFTPRHQGFNFAHHGNPQQLRKLNVIPQFRMRIERQVIAVQVDVIRQQRFETVALHAANNR